MRNAGADVGLPLSATGVTLRVAITQYEKRIPNLRTATPPPHQTKPVAGFRPLPSELGEPAAGRNRRRVPSHPFRKPRPGGWGRGINPKSNYGFRRKKGLGACQSQPEATIAKCVHCEDSRSLRYDQDLGGWVCFQGCGQPQPEPQLKRRSPKKLQWKRSPLFEPWWLVDGARVKLRHSELREAYRLWAAHKDIREGRFRG